MDSRSQAVLRNRTALPVAAALLIAAVLAVAGSGCRAQTPADLGGKPGGVSDGSTAGGSGQARGQAGGAGTQSGGTSGAQTGETGAKYDPKRGLSRETAVIVTNRGTIVFAFYPKEAPKTVASFKKLAGEGFYNGSKWHRVEPGFVIQGGDPLSKDNDPANDGTGGPGYTIPAEFNEHRHVTGAVAMARASDPNSGGSQFYITLAPQPTLDGQYTVFGLVTKGMGVVRKIQKGDVMRRVYVRK